MTLPASETADKECTPLPKKPARWWLRLLIAGVLLLLMLLGLFWFRGDPDRQLTISPETTYLTEPLTPEGYVDYAAAMEQKFSAGVTPENNAVPLLLEAFGPLNVLEAEQIDEEFRERLGITTVRNDPRCFVSWNDGVQPTHIPAIAQSREDAEACLAADPEFYFPEDFLPTEHPDLPLDLDEIENRVSEQPWSRDEFPQVAKWLTNNAWAFDRIAEAAERPRYYFPLSRKDGMPTSHDFLCNETCGAAQTLVIRGMLAIHEGRFRDALDDALTIDRLRNLVSHEREFMQILVAQIVQHRFVSLAKKLLSHPDIPPELATELRLQLAQRIPQPPLQYVTAERCKLLSQLQIVARDGYDDSMLRLFAGGEFTLRLYNNVIDWDGIARERNAWYDAVEHAFSAPTYAERLRLRKQVDVDFAEWEFRIPKYLPVNDRDIEDFACEPYLQSDLLERWEQSKAERLVLMTACAVREYRLQHNRYPATLAELRCPDVSRLHADTYDGRPLRYSATPEGFRVYSLGANGIDDGGMLVWHDGAAVRDDIAITVGPAWAE